MGWPTPREAAPAPALTRCARVLASSLVCLPSATVPSQPPTRFWPRQVTLPLPEVSLQGLVRHVLSFFRTPSVRRDVEPLPVVVRLSHCSSPS